VARAVLHLGFQCIVTNEIKKITKAERIIFPGVGAAGSAIDSLKRLGLDKAIKAAFAAGKPILGICLGTQIIMVGSEEDNASCLGIINGYARALPVESGLKIPHMGWNSVQIKSNHPVLAGVGKDDEFYFVHSFYPDPADAKQVIGITDYGISFPSIIGFNNIIATQFHPEKSGRPGLGILRNFCMWEPC